MLGAMNKVTFSLRKTLVIVVKFRPCLGVNVGCRVSDQVYIMKNIDKIYMLALYARLLLALLFSLKHT